MAESSNETFTGGSVAPPGSLSSLTIRKDGQPYREYNPEGDPVTIDLESGGGGGLDKVYHDETLTGDGTPGDPLSSLIGNADISFEGSNVEVNTHGGTHKYSHSFIDDRVVVQEL